MAPKKRVAAVANEDPTPKPKRGRSATDALDETPDKSVKQTSTPKAAKRDKNSPLPRSLTPRELMPPPESRVLKLMSLNVAGLRAVLKGNKAQTLRALVEREAPDVLCLNEHKLKVEDVSEAEEQLKELLPEYAKIHWSCSTEKKGYSGVAMLLRQPTGGEAATVAIPQICDATVTEGMGKVHEADPIISREGRILTLELPELYVIATYVPNSGMELDRLAYRTDREATQCWDRALGQYVRGLSAGEPNQRKPVVLLGDLNCCHGVQDMWNTHDRPDFPEGLAAKPVDEQYVGLSALRKAAGLTPEERKSFPLFLEDAGCVDTFRALHPNASGVFSYFSQRIVQNRPMNKGLRLDYVLASSSLCDHVRARSGEGSDPAITEDQSAAALPLPRVHDSFILDEDDLVADHAAVGCLILLPPL